MSLTSKVFHYQGKHCIGACAESCEGKMCQCKFDRNYERQCFERPRTVQPAAVSSDQHNKDIGTEK